MTTSIVQICNQALARIGDYSNITSLTENTNEAANCNLFYNLARQALLQAHQWGWATTVKNLTLSAAEPLGFDYAYAYPTGAINVNRIFDTTDETLWHDQDPYEFEVRADPDDPNKTIICTNLQYAGIVYTADVTDPNKFPPLFQTALTWLLAADITIPLTEKRAMRQENFQLYQAALNAAAASDAREGWHTYQRTPDFITNRN